MKIKLSILMLFAVIMLGTFVYSAENVSTKKQLSAPVQQFVNYAKNPDSTDISGKLEQLSQKEQLEFADYLETHSSEFPPIYFIMMADIIYKTDKDKAVLWYAIGKMRTTEDVLMCKDTTAQGQLQIYPMLAPKTLKYSSKNISSSQNPNKYISELLQKTLDWDIAHEERVSPIWACYHGITAYLMDEPEIVGKSEQKKIINKVRKEFRDSIKASNKK